MLSVFDQGPPPPCPTPFNMARHVLRAGRADADKIALSVLGAETSQDWTYGALERAVRGTATGLLATGLTPGDTVVLRLGNTVDFPVAYLGAIAAGLVPVPTSAQLTTRETALILDHLTPATVIQAPDIADAPHPRTIPLDHLRKMRDLPGAPWHMGDANRPAYIVYTSGTSGTPRAVAHAHRAIWARRMMGPGWHDLRAEDRLFHAGAFNWTFTMGTGLMDPWAAGATALIAGDTVDPASLPALLATHGVTIFAAAPGIYRKMLANQPHLHLPDLRHGLCAGEKLPAPLHHQWQTATGCDLLEAYGLSECSTFISASPGNPARGAALGCPQPGRHVAILGPDGPVAKGQDGIIAIHRDDPGLMLGYVGAPAATAARFQGDWFLTGDHGAMAADGQITYLGRGDDMMNAGGLRVSPLEIEAVLSDMNGIDQVAVTDVEIRPDVFIIAAFYTAPAPLDETGLAAYVGERLARYKHPRAYIHLPSLPTGANGKVQRRALRPYLKVPAP